MTKSDSSPATSLDADFLLKVLACPRCKGGLTYSALSQSLDCMGCKLHYLVKDGIPMLLIEEAQPF
jgi:uncharacterized protein YbaR (Trm112 family)